MRQSSTAFTRVCPGGLVLGRHVPAGKSQTQTAEVIPEWGLPEGATALRDGKKWRKPRKIVLTSMGSLDELKAAAPGIDFVVVTDLEQMGREAVDADAIASGDNLVCDDSVLAAAKKLQWIAVYSAGVEACLDKPSLEKGGIVVTNMRAIAGPVMAEHSIALAYAGPQSARFCGGMPPRGWVGLCGLTAAGTHGQDHAGARLGRIGPRRAKPPMRSHEYRTRNSSRDKPEFVSYVGLADELPTLIQQADVVVAALPLVPATTNLFDAKMFARMKKTAYFINVGRGGSVVTDDLVAALNSGTIAGAGVDVTEPEPLPRDHALWKAKNIIISPHMSAQSDLGQGVRALIFREQVRRFAAGDKLLSVVDFSKGY